ncbi:MAG: hypothetical protein K0R34_3566 [Herbinix sp.]|jgi:hypothetical protein|nr:hypothetical protein [Herbinix sp.]
MKRYIRLNFQNSPSTATPLNTTNLNKIDKGIDDCDNAIEDLYNIKFDKANIANNLVTAASGLALDARQGTALKAMIDAQNDNLTKIKKYATGYINCTAGALKNINVDTSDLAGKTILDYYIKVVNVSLSNVFKQSIVYYAVGNIVFTTDVTQDYAFELVVFYK